MARRGRGASVALDDAARRSTSRHRDRLLAAALAGGLYCVEIATESHFAGDRAVSYPGRAGSSARRSPSAGARRSLAAGGRRRRHRALEPRRPARSPTPARSSSPSLLAIYSAGRYTRGRALSPAWPLLVAAVPLAAIEPGDPFAFTDLAFFAIFFVGPWLAGRCARQRRRERERVPRARARRARPRGGRRGARAHRARAARRRRARDQRDRAAGARRAADARPTDPDERARRSTRSSTPASRRWRRCAGCSACCASTTSEPALAPQPSLRAHRRARRRASAPPGLPVELDVEGEPVELPPGVDVSAYRIVQEALTNALKHAGPAHARVTVRYAARRASSSRSSTTAPGDAATATAAATAWPGMRERVALYGGELEAGAAARGRLRAARAAAAAGGAMIRVLLADDQALVRAGLPHDPQAPSPTSRSSARPATAREAVAARRDAARPTSC